MKYLLDTVVFLWVLDAQHNLNKAAQKILQDRAQQIFLSSVVSWEMVIKMSRGKLKLSRSPAEMLQRAFTELGAQSLPVTHVHTLELTGLPALHNDPFDRMLVAQARAEGMILMTADSLLQNYPVQTLSCGK